MIQYRHLTVAKGRCQIDSLARCYLSLPMRFVADVTTDAPAFVEPDHQVCRRHSSARRCGRAVRAEIARPNGDGPPLAHKPDERAPRPPVRERGPRTRDRNERP